MAQVTRYAKWLLLAKPRTIGNWQFFQCPMWRADPRIWRYGPRDPLYCERPRDQLRSKRRLHAKGKSNHLRKDRCSDGEALIACIATHGQDVRTNYMAGTDFTKYHTYKWVDIEGGAHPNQIVDAQIKQSVDSQLASKGLTKTDSDKADLFVGYQVAVDQSGPGMLRRRLIRNRARKRTRRAWTRPCRSC